MIPVVGDAIGKSGKAARFIAKKGDDILATGRWIKCKVTGKGCFVAGTKVWVSARAGDDRAEPLDSTNGSVALAASRKITLEAIEAVAIGSRVSGENPRPWEFDGELPEPDQATWLLGKFSLQKENGNWIDVEMIRPADYWEAQEAVPGNYVYMEFPELEASGLAKVKSIEPCPPIAQGEGHAVTSRIITRQANELVEIEIEGGETLTGTPLHPIWIIEAQDWINLEEVEPGQHVWTEDGPLEITSKRLLTSAESVYNIEVYGEHLYQVTDLGVLVHNVVDVGKPSGYNPTNFRSFVSVLLTHIPTRSTLYRESKGAFTKLQARNVAMQFIRALIQEHKCSATGSVVRNKSPNDKRKRQR